MISGALLDPKIQSTFTDFRLSTAKTVISTASTTKTPILRMSRRVRFAGVLVGDVSDTSIVPKVALTPRGRAYARRRQAQRGATDARTRDGSIGAPAQREPSCSRAQTVLWPLASTYPRPRWQ